MKSKSNDGIAAASATYRTATNEVARRLKVKPDHTRKPREDFLDTADMIDVKSKERALEWYERGMIRGFIEATNLFLDGTIELNNGVLEAPNELKIRVKVKFTGENWQRKQIVIDAKDIGFE